MRTNLESDREHATRWWHGGGGLDRMLVFSIPVSVGFQVVKRLLDEFVRTLPGTTWWHGNV
jgi:hypothetical protein